MTWHDWWQLKLMDLKVWAYVAIPFWTFVCIVAYVATRKDK